MAGAQLRIDDREVRALLARLGAAADDLAPAMKRVGAAIEADTGRRFEEGAGPGGTRWPPSLRATLQGGRTLVDRGRLSDSITYEAGARSVRVGTNVIYAAIHQFGGTIRAKGGGRLGFRLADGGFRSPSRVSIPARPFLGIDDEQEGIALTEIEDWLAERAGPEAGR
jgi:phage virion morphogenesis protein